MSNSVESKTLGYSFTTNGQGMEQMDVLINMSPTLAHYDPEVVRLPIVLDGGIILKSIRHPYTGTNHFQVAPGAFQLRDRLEKPVCAYSFGGRLSISSNEKTSRIVVTSSAPTGLIEPHQKFDTLSRDQHLSRLFIDFQILLSRIKVGWGFANIPFQNRLTSLAPNTIYLATLQEISSTLGRTRRELCDENFFRYSGFVASEIARLNQYDQLALSELLAPDRV